MLFTKSHFYRILRTVFLQLMFLLLGSISLTWAFAWQDTLSDNYGIDVSGFAEIRHGQRLQNDDHQKSASISEMRWQLAVESYQDWATFTFKGDLVGDQVRESVDGEVRELNLGFSPLNNVDLKIGRQALTWGTGDLLFVNDLFPKDWKSFFIGRNDEYLKSPVDALKLSFFSTLANVNVAYMPVFNGSQYIDGSRLSYWNPITSQIAGNDYIMVDDEPNRFFRDDEIAVRVFKMIGSTEIALYGYNGFWKTPEGIDPATLHLTYPRLAVYGASVRTPLLGGVTNLETGYYDSRDDRKGNNPYIRNSEMRFLAGFEREIVKNLTAGIQYYAERMADYDAYKQSMGGSTLKDRLRQVITLRLTQLLMNQNLSVGLFTYYSPTDQDAYLRPHVHYKVSDNWAAEAGANIFTGKQDYTFFGQFENNTNAYIGLRYSY